MRRNILIVVGVLSVLSGCGGAFGRGTAERPPEMIGEPAPTAAASTAASSSPPSLTLVPPSTVSPTTVPPTTVPPSTLVGGFTATQEAAYSCLVTVTICEADEVAVPTGPAHEFFSDLIELYRTNGYEARLQPALSHDTVISSETTADGRGGYVTACSVDGHWIVEPASAPGGLDTIVNDEIVSRLVQVELRLTEAGWRRWEIVVLGQWPGDTTCAV